MGGDNPEVSESKLKQIRSEEKPSFQWWGFWPWLWYQQILEQQSKVQNKGHGKPRDKSIVDEKLFQLFETKAYLENREKEEEWKNYDDDDEVDDTDCFLR